MTFRSNPAVDLAPFGRWTLRDKAAQRRSPLRWAAIVTSRLFLLLLALFSVSFVVCAESAVPINEGATTLSSTAAGRKVVVTLTSRLLRSADVIANAEPGQFPERFLVVQSLKVQVSGTEIVVPHSAYADLAWVAHAKLKVAKPRSTLTISGGDASESYSAKIEFDGKAVRLRRLYGNEYSETLPTEETKYFLRVLN